MAEDSEKSCKKPVQGTRRNLLKSVVVGGVGVSSTLFINPTQAQKTANTSNVNAVSPSYVFFKPDEASWIEAMVNHMIPADHLSPSGVDLGVNIFIDRALNNGWGKGDRLYLEGSWEQGTATQGYQLPLTPAQIYRRVLRLLLHTGLQMLSKNII
jgi:gluconate 2-dehydrogenase gamma chain